MPAVGSRAALLIALVLALGAPASGGAQEPSECERGECRGSDDLAQAAARLQRARADFVLSFRRLLEALPGTYGDEGPALGAAVAGMDEALGRWDRAIRAYQSPLEKVSGNAEVHVALGTVQLERGRLKQAIDELTAASRLAPDGAPVFMLLGLAFDAAGRHVDAATAFARAATLAPDNLGALYAAAQQARQSGALPAVVERLRAFHQAVEPRLPPPTAPRTQPFLRAALLRESGGVAPIWPPARYVAAFEAMGRGAYTEALAALGRAVTGDPLTAAIPPAAAGPLAAGRVALRAGQLRAALGHLEAAVAAAPDLAEPRRLLALALAADDRPDDAVEHLRHAVRLDPADERSRLALGRTLAAAGRSDLAEQAFREAIAAIPLSAQSQFELGRLHDAAGRHREAAVAFTAAAAVTPVIGEERVHELRGRALVAEADFDGALQAFARRVDVSPNYAAAHRALGETYLQMGRIDEALGELAAASWLDPSDATAHALRAQLYLRAARYQEAAGAAQAALARDSAHGSALYALGTALVRLGRTVEGEAALARFGAAQDAARASEERAWERRLLRQTAAGHVERGELTAAVAPLQAAVALQPDAEAYAMLGAVLKRAGRWPEALAALEQAAARGAGPGVHTLLAEVLIALGRAEDGRRHLELAARARDERFRAGAPQ